MDFFGMFEFAAILGSIIIIPLLWVLLRKENSTDREGREPPIPNMYGDVKQPGSNMPVFGPGMDYTSQAIGKEWEHPDVTREKERNAKAKEKKTANNG